MIYFSLLKIEFFFFPYWCLQLKLFDIESFFKLITKSCSMTDSFWYVFMTGYIRSILHFFLLRLGISYFHKQSLFLLLGEDRTSWPSSVLYDFLLIGVIICLGCHNKTLQTLLFKQQTFIFSKFWRLEV